MNEENEQFSQFLSDSILKMYSNLINHLVNRLKIKVLIKVLIHY